MSTSYIGSEMQDYLGLNQDSDLSQLPIIFDKPQRGTFTSLPLEIHHQIGIHLPFPSLLNLTKSSQTLYSAYIYSCRTFNERSRFLKLPESIHRKIAFYIRNAPEPSGRSPSARHLTYMSYLCKKSYKIYNPLLYSNYTRILSTSRRALTAYFRRSLMERATDFPSVKALERIFCECGWQAAQGQDFAVGLLHRLKRNRMRHREDRLTRARDSFTYLVENLRLVEDEAVFTSRVVLVVESLLLRGVVWAVKYLDMVGLLLSSSLGSFLTKTAKRVHENPEMMELLLEISKKRREDGDPLMEEIFDRKNLTRLAREVMSCYVITNNRIFTCQWNHLAIKERQEKLVRDRVEFNIGALKALLSIDPEIDLTTVPSTEDQPTKDSLSTLQTPSPQRLPDHIFPCESLDYDYFALPQFVALGGNPELFRKLLIFVRHSNPKVGRSASLLHVAIQPYLICTSHTDYFNHVLKYNSLPIDIRAGPLGNTALLKAVQHHLRLTEESEFEVPFSHYLTCITSLLSAGASITAKNDLGISPLSLAIMYKDVNLLSLFNPTNLQYHLKTPINPNYLTFRDPSFSTRLTLVEAQAALVHADKSLAQSLIFRALFTYYSGYFRQEILHLLCIITSWTPDMGIDPAEMLDGDGISPVMIAAAWEGVGDENLLHSVTSSLGRPSHPTRGRLMWRKEEREQAMLWLKNGAFWEDSGPAGLTKMELWERVKAGWEKKIREEGIQERL